MVASALVSAREFPQPRPTVIEARRISKTYGSNTASGKTSGGGIVALHELSFDVCEHEFVSILGPSGCGKSTLLRTIAGLTPFEGEALAVNGEPVVEPMDDVGVVFQSSNLLPWRTVAANLRLGAEIRREELEPRRMEAMLDMIGLAGFENRYPHELSGGMRQRVAMGQALVRNPRVLLLDEPFGALDALTRDKLNVELLRIWQAEQKTVVLVTHSIPEAILLSDRVLVLSERPGRLVEDVRIDLPRPRDPRSTRASSDFGKYVVRLGELMGVQ